MRKHIINLIRHHRDDNNAGFRDTASKIAYEMDKQGDHGGAEFIRGLLSDESLYSNYINNMNLAYRIKVSDEPLYLPDDIKEGFLKIVNSKNSTNFNKFILHGKSGTGKTESVRHIARIMQRELFVVNNFLILDKFASSYKNIEQLFKEINSLYMPDRVVILFDDLDKVMHYMLENDPKINKAFIEGLNNLNKDVIFIAVCDEVDLLDKNIRDCFDESIDFDNYTQKDLVEIAEHFLKDNLEKLDKFEGTVKNMPLFRKIMSLKSDLDNPNAVKEHIENACTSYALDNEDEFLQEIYKTMCKDKNIELHDLRNKGFFIKDIALVTKKSAREIVMDLKKYREKLRKHNNMI